MDHKAESIRTENKMLKNHSENFCQTRIPDENLFFIIGCFLNVIKTIASYKGKIALHASVAITK